MEFFEIRLKTVLMSAEKMEEFLRSMSTCDAEDAGMHLNDLRQEISDNDAIFQMIDSIWTSEKWSRSLSSIVEIENLESETCVKVCFEFKKPSYDFALHLSEIFGLLGILDYAIYSCENRMLHDARIEFTESGLTIDGQTRKLEKGSDYIDFHWQSGPKLKKDKAESIRDAIGDLDGLSDLDSILAVLEKIYPTISELGKVYDLKKPLLDCFARNSIRISDWKSEIPAIERLMFNKYFELIELFHSTVCFGSIYTEYNKILATLAHLQLMAKEGALDQLDNLINDGEFEEYFQFGFESLERAQDVFA